MLEPAPGVEFGRYVLVGRPTYYGAGSLVAAREARSGARRTLWLLMPHIAGEPAQRASVVRVATALRKLDSPHLLDLHEFGEVDGQPFFATAPLDGVDLAQACAPDGIPPEDALDLVAQIGTGLNHLHHAGLVDGALGPHRVLVEQRDGQLHATVAHAGILPVLLPTSALFGTQKQEALDFGAPELHRGDVPTARSDVYSLGCLLWLALTGGQPFTSYVGHRSAPTPQVAGDGPVEQALNIVLQRALAKDPAARYRDVAAFVATVRSIAALVRDGAVGELPERLVPRPADAAPSDAREEPAAPAVPVSDAPEIEAPADAWLAKHVEVSFEPEPGLAALWAPAHGAAIHVPPQKAPEPAPDAAPEAAPEPAPDAAPEPAPEPELASPPVPETERALEEAVKHWAARAAAPRKLHDPRNRQRVVRAGVVAAGLGALAVVAVWGVRHLELIEPAAPVAATSASATTEPASTAAAQDTPDPLARLFPIAGSRGCRQDTARAEHRIERWTCQRTGYRVVLTHWDSRAHARTLVPHGGEQGAREKWELQGKRAGTQWTWRSAAGPLPFRWTAVYADVPYAVTIEASSTSRRHQARQQVAIHPSTVLG